MDWPAWITAGATVTYVVVSAALWQSNRKQAEHTQASLDLARKAFDKTHQPIIAVNLALESTSQSFDDLGDFRLTCTATNHGEDAAAGLEVTISGTNNYVVKTFRFGELFPHQTREAFIDFSMDAAGVRVWIREHSDRGAIKFSVSRRYTTSTEEARFVESVTEHIASDLIVALWQGLSDRASGPSS